MKTAITFCLLSFLIANVTLAAQAAPRRATKSYTSNRGQGREIESYTDGKSGKSAESVNMLN